MSVASLWAGSVAAQGCPISETRMSGGATTPTGTQAVAAGITSGDRFVPSSRPRLGVLDFNPIQYHTPTTLPFTSS